MTALLDHPFVLWVSAPFKLLFRHLARHWKVWLVTLAVLGAIGGTVKLLIHHIDYTRAIYKRLKADNEYVFDKIPPHIQKTDPAALIRLKTPEDVATLRQDLITKAWGHPTFPAALQPTEVSTIAVPAQLDADQVKSVERLVIPVDPGYTAYPLLIHPNKPNGRLVIYQHGYAGVFLDFHHVLDELVEEGFTVLANNFPGYGENDLTAYQHERFGYYFHRPHQFMNYVEWALTYYFDPLAAAINYAMEKHSLNDVAMIGFSAGGWATAVYAALDDRIKQSYPVAGILPMYTKIGDRPPEHYYRPLIHTANYLEMYTIAASGSGHNQLQLFNQFDRCCYGNRYGEHFQGPVNKIAKGLGGGGFDVFIDTSHADHKISDAALEAIIEDLKRFPH